MKSAIAENLALRRPTSVCESAACNMGIVLQPGSRGFAELKMTLKIERNSMGSTTTIRLIGRIRSEHLLELKEEMASVGPRVVLDLDEVTLVDIDAVRFLAGCEAEGAQVLHCSAYIREWMLREVGKEKR